MGPSARAAARDAAEGAAPASVYVRGMVCSFCAQGIRKKFLEEGAVEAVKIQLADRLVQIWFKPGKSLSDDAIRDILVDSGFALDHVSR